jgi:phosphatidyl-myo-inositol dimannoside synthase
MMQDWQLRGIRSDVREGMRSRGQEVQGNADEEALQIESAPASVIGPASSTFRDSKQAMKVLVLTPHVDTVGGVQRYAKTLIEAFEDLLGNENVRRVALPDAQTQGNRTRIGASARFWFTCRALQEAVRFRPDLIVCCHVGLAPVGWLVHVAMGRPYWVIAYGIDVWCRLPIVKKKVLQRAAKILSVSDFTGKQAVKLHGVAGERAVTLTPCIAREDWLTLRPAEGPLAGLGLEGSRVILTVARLAASERYKGHDVVLRSLPAVIERVPNLKYLIVGDGDDRPRLEKMVQDLRLQSHIVFLGKVPDDAHLAACYRACDVFILPARTIIDDRDPKGEGFGIVYLEAMTFGKPVIAPNYGAPAGIIRHGQHGLLVDPEDSEAIAASLTDLLTHPDVAREMGQAGSEWVKQHYSYNSFCGRLRELLAASATTGRQA